MRGKHIHTWTNCPTRPLHLLRSAPARRQGTPPTHYSWQLLPIRTLFPSTHTEEHITTHPNTHSLHQHKNRHLPGKHHNRHCCSKTFCDRLFRRIKTFINDSFKKSITPWFFFVLCDVKFTNQSTTYINVSSSQWRGMSLRLDYITVCNLNDKIFVLAL